jgi:hypothetical protein
VITSVSWSHGENAAAGDYSKSESNCLCIVRVKRSYPRHLKKTT